MRDAVLLYTPLVLVLVSVDGKSSKLSDCDYISVYLYTDTW